MGLTSRAGVFPLSLLADIAGPMAPDRGRCDGGVPSGRRRGSERRGHGGLARARHSRYADALNRDALARDAHRRAAAGLRARHDRPGDRAGVHAAVEDLTRAGATIVDPAAVDGLEAIRACPGMARVPGLQARHQRVPGGAQGTRAGGRPRRDRQGRQVPSHGAAPAGAGGAGAGERPGDAGVQGRGGVSRSGAGRGAED